MTALSRRLLGLLRSLHSALTTGSEPNSKSVAALRVNESLIYGQPVDGVLDGCQVWANTTTDVALKAIHVELENVGPKIITPHLGRLECLLPLSLPLSHRLLLLFHLFAVLLLGLAVGGEEVLSALQSQVNLDGAEQSVGMGGKERGLVGEKHQE